MATEYKIISKIMLFFSLILTSSGQTWWRSADSEMFSKYTMQIQSPPRVMTQKSYRDLACLMCLQSLANQALEVVNTCIRFVILAVSCKSIVLSLNWPNVAPSYGRPCFPSLCSAKLSKYKWRFLSQHKFTHEFGFYPFQHLTPDVLALWWTVKCC